MVASSRREPLDRLGRHVAESRAALDRIGVEALEQLVVAERVGAAPLVVGEALVDQRAHHPERQGTVRPGKRAHVLVRDSSRPASVWVDDDEARPVSPCLEQEPPEMRRGRHRIPADEEQVAGVWPFLGIDLGREPLGRGRAREAGIRAHGPPETRGADGVHEARARRVALEDAHRAVVAVGKNRLGPVALERVREAGGDRVEGLGPACSAETSLALGAVTQERVEEAIVRVDPLEVVRNLAAQESCRDRVLRVAHHVDRTVAVDGDEHRAGIRAIVWAGRADDSAHAETLDG